jgi:hypothetical protein
MTVKRYTFPQKHLKIINRLNELLIEKTKGAEVPEKIVVSINEFDDYMKVMQHREEHEGLSLLAADRKYHHILFKGVPVTCKEFL